MSASGTTASRGARDDRELWDEGQQLDGNDASRVIGGLRAEWDRVFREPIAFYREKYSAAGLGADGFPELDDIPLTRKHELRSNEGANPPFGTHRTVGPDAAARVSATTGTTGKPWLIFYSKRDLEIMVSLQYQHTWRVGLRPGHHFAHSWPGGMYPTAVLGGRHLLDLRILEIPVGPPFSLEQAAGHVELWQTLGIDALMCTASQLQTYDEAASSLGVDLADVLAGSRLIFVEASCQFEPVRRRIENAYGVRLHNLSGAGEVLGFVTSDCRYHQGLHIPAGNHHIQVCDPVTGRALPAGERGTLVVSLWGMDAFCLRYDVEDIVVAEAGDCPCGQAGPRYTLIGRSADRAIVAGRWILPLDVQLGLEDFAAPEFQLVAGESDALRLTVETDRPAEVEEALSARFEVPVRAVASERGSLPRATFKPRRVAT